MLATYQAAFDALPAAARSPERRAALDAFMTLGLPTPDLEDWKYTDLSPLLKLDAGALVAPGAAAGCPRLGAEFRDGVDALNYAFCAGGLDRTVAAGEGPVSIVLAGAGHQRHRLKLERNAQAVVLLDGSEAGIFQTVFAELELAANAQLRLVRLGAPPAGAHVITRINVRLDRDAQFHAVTIDLDGKLCRHDLTVSLDAPGAAVHLAGLYLLGSESFVDNHTRVDHRAPHGTSRELFRGIVRDRAQAVFNGKVVVHAHAIKTDSEQHVATLLLSPHAQVNAKPELQIDNDDVKCAHGATCGQLDEAAIYYMRSRGLPLDAARNALLCAFADEVLARISDPALRSRTETLVHGRLRNGGLA